MGSMKYCQEITEMIERSKLERTSIMDKLSIRMHLLICKPCKVFSKDSAAMDQILHKRFKKLDQYSFSKSEKEKIKKSL